MSTNHYRRAEELLERAAELEGGVRHTVAKTLATMAQAHATLALVKATRQQPIVGELEVTADMPVDLVVSKRLGGAEQVVVPGTERELHDYLAAYRRGDTADVAECGVEFGGGFVCTMPAGHDEPETTS